MNASQKQEEVSTYGINADYSELPDASQIASGVKPLDTLPAQWWNALWLQTTKQSNNCLLDVLNIREELISVLTAASLSPDGTSTNQLLSAIEILRKKVATSSEPGSILSSSDIKSVSVSSTDGTVTVNGLADWDSPDTVRSRLEDIGSDLSASVNTSTKILTISVNGHSATVDLSGIVGSVTRATYARYLVPNDTSTSTAVYVSPAGQLNANTIGLNG